MRTIKSLVLIAVVISASAFTNPMTMKKKIVAQLSEACRVNQDLKTAGSQALLAALQGKPKPNII